MKKFIALFTVLIMLSSSFSSYAAVDTTPSMPGETQWYTISDS